jgi:hypothetical protein
LLQELPSCHPMLSFQTSCQLMGRTLRLHGTVGAPMCCTLCPSLAVVCW